MSAGRNLLTCAQVAAALLLGFALAGGCEPCVDGAGRVGCPCVPMAENTGCVGHLACTDGVCLRPVMPPEG